MDIELFHNIIRSAVIEECGVSLPAKQFLENLHDILTDRQSSSLLKSTQMTILFEGFYHSLTSSKEIKKQLLSARQQRWAKHYGTPTISFLLTYQSQINETKNFFLSKDKFEKKSWKIYQTAQLSLDSENNLLIDTESVSAVPLPKCDKTEQFIKTYNPHGGFAIDPSDLYSQTFIEYTKEVALSHGKVLEIGAAFGTASLKALSNNTTVFCNDIDPQNLAVIYNRYLQEISHSEINDKKLILLPGAFPDELSALPKDFFDAVLISRVLHFFPGQKIEESLTQIREILKPRGKIFLVCETPFLKNWQPFIPEYEKRVLKQLEWPGEISNPSEFENSGRASSLPPFVHWITKEVLDRSLQRTGFAVAQSSYIDRKNQFPEDLVLSGKESVGAIGIKK